MNADCTGGLAWRISCIVFFLMSLAIALFTPVLACCLSTCCQECCCSNQVYPDEKPEPTAPMMPRYPNPNNRVGTRQNLSNVREGHMSTQPVMGTAVAMPPAKRSLLQPPQLQPPPIRRSSLQPPKAALITTEQRQAWGDQEQLQLLNAQQRLQQQRLQDEQALERQSLQERQGQSQWRSLPPSQQQQLRKMSAPLQQPAQFGERIPAYAVQPSAPEHDPYDWHTWSVTEAEQYHLAASDMQPGSEWRVFYDTAYAAWYDNMYPNWRAQAQLPRQQR